MQWRLLAQRSVYLFDKPRPIWWAVAILAVSAYLVFLVKGEQLLRMWGMALQLLGVVAVLHELRQLQDRHRISFRETVAAWWRGWPSRKTVIGVGAAVLESASMSGRAHLRTTIDPASPVENQIAAIAKYLSQVDTEIGALWKSLDDATRSHTASLKAETAARERSTRELRDAAVNEASGRLPLAYFGQFCLLLGIILATASPEIASWFG